MGTVFFQSGGLMQVLSTDRNFYNQNVPVIIRLFKQNISPFPITLTYTSSQRYDFTASFAWRELWRWSADQVFLPVVEEVTLFPGQFVTYSAVWPQEDNEGNTVPPGIYRITGWNTSRQTQAVRPSMFIRIL